MPDTKHFVSGARVVSILTLLSRILGMLRDIFCAAAFGAGELWSAFSIAFQIPNLFRRLFGEGALSSAFIPVFSEVRQAGDEQRAQRLAGTVVVGMSIMLIGLILIGELVVAGLGQIVEPNTRNLLTLRLTGYMLPFALFICVVAVLGGLLNVLGHFAAPAAAPCILNIAMLTDVAVGWFIPGLRDQTRLEILTIAVLVAGVLELLLQFWALRRCRFRFRPALAFRDEALRRIVSLTGPMIIGLAVVQINTLADSLIAYLFVPHHGAPGKLYYAQRLYQFPEGVFLIAIATAIYPQFSLMAARKDMTGFAESVLRGLRMTLFIGVPASVGLIIVREPLVGLVFERSLFTSADTVRTAATLGYYAGAIWAYGLLMMLTRAFYALQDSKTPVRISVVMVALNFTLNIVLVHRFPEPQERGLAFATAICAAIQSAWLGWKLSRRIGHIDWSNLFRGAVQIVIATAVMAALCLAVGTTLGQRYSVRLAGLLTVGLGSFVAMSWLMKIPEMHDLLHLRRRSRADQA